ARTRTLELRPGSDGADVVLAFMDASGSAWAARPDVIQRAGAAINELVESLAARDLATGPVLIEARFDEFNLDLTVTYQGRPLVFPRSQPSAEAVIEDEDALAELSGFLVQRYADNIRVAADGSRCRVSLHFDH